MNKKALSLLMAGTLAVCAAGCGNKTTASDVKKLANGNYYVSEKGEAVEYNSLYFDFLGGKDVMPVGGFYGVYNSGGTIDGLEIPQMVSDKYFKMISDAGVNMVVYSRDEDAATVKKTLELGEKYGIGLFANVNEITTFCGRQSDATKRYKAGDKMPFGVTEMTNYISSFAAYDSFLGIKGADEPFWYQLDALKATYDVLRDVDYGNTELYVNSLGYGGGDLTYGGWEENITQEQYFNKIYGDIKVPFLSATGYFYTQKDTPDSELSMMFTQLSQIRSIANNYKVPMWRMLQAGGQWNDAAQEIESVNPYPDEGELLFDVNIALCYGCKAIQYFPLVEPVHFAYAPGGTYDFDRNGIISAAGNKTRWYYYVQKANTQIKAIDHVLMNSANIGMIVHGKKANLLADTQADNRAELIRDGKFRQLTSVSGDDCFVGCFDYNGGTALYVVNYSRKDKANVTLNFDKTYGYEVIQRAVSAEVAAKNLPLTLEAGEGALVVLK